MALKPEILKIYEDIIFQKKDDGSYEFTPHDNEDAEYFNYHFRKELGGKSDANRPLIPIVIGQ